MPQKKLDNDFVIDDDEELQYVRQLGSGGYGSVHELFYTPKQRSLARKVVYLPSRDKAYVEREVKAIQKLCVGTGIHPNIVQVMNHGLLWNSPYYYIDMELCDMNLEDYLLQQTPSNSVGLFPCYIKGGGLDALIQTWTIMSQIASGVEYIHCEHQIHRDIKPGNVLYSSKHKLWKLADFGLSVEGSSKTNRLTTSAKGTPGYRSPELLDFVPGESAQHTNRVDIWAMGCILYQLVTGTQLFISDSAVVYYVYSAKSLEVPLDNTFDADSTQIITKYIVDMLQVKPGERPSAATLSMEFNRHLLLARQRAGLSDVLTVAETEEPIPETSTALQKPRVVAASTDLPVTTQTVPMTPPRRKQDSLATESSKIHGQALPPHLGAALYGASVQGHVETDRWLLDKGADVNAGGGMYGNALQAASSKGNVELVRLLLENGADVNAQGGLYGNALNAASSNGHEAVVRLLRAAPTRFWLSRMAYLLKHRGARTSTS